MTPPLTLLIKLDITDEVLVAVRSLFFFTPPLTLFIKLEITDEVLVDVRSFLGFFDASPKLRGGFKKEKKKG